MNSLLFIIDYKTIITIVICLAIAIIAITIAFIIHDKTINDYYLRQEQIDLMKSLNEDLIDLAKIENEKFKWEVTEYAPIDEYNNKKNIK